MVFMVFSNVLWYFYGIFMVFVYASGGSCVKTNGFDTGRFISKGPPLPRASSKEIMDFSCSTLARGPEVRGDPWFLLCFSDLL